MLPSSVGSSYFADICCCLVYSIHAISSPQVRANYRLYNDCSGSPPPKRVAHLSRLESLVKAEDKNFTMRRRASYRKVKRLKESSAGIPTNSPRYNIQQLLCLLLLPVLYFREWGDRSCELKSYIYSCGFALVVIFYKLASVGWVKVKILNGKDLHFNHEAQGCLFTWVFG